MGWLGFGLSAIVFGILLYRVQKATKTVRTYPSSHEQQPAVIQQNDDAQFRDEDGAVTAEGGAHIRDDDAVCESKHQSTSQDVVEAAVEKDITSSNGTVNPYQKDVLASHERQTHMCQHSPRRLKPPPTFGTMSAPSRPLNGTSLRPAPSAAASLRVPQRKVLSNTSMAPSSLMPPPPPPPPSKASRKVILAPGHSPLDWAMLTSNPKHKLRGQDVPDNLIRVPPSMLKQHIGRRGRDTWTVYQGKVYNITPYLPYHPGGERELMRAAGHDAAKLFMEVHPWVNWEAILNECLVGILVGEGEEKPKVIDTAGGLDEMD